MSMTKTTKPEWMKTERLHNERWEDEGGTAAAIKGALSPGRFVRPMLKTTGVQDPTRKWSSTFTIEPLALGLGFPKKMLQAKSKPL
jgi:hypothetical protein